METNHQKVELRNDTETCHYCKGQLDQTVVTYNYKECTRSIWKSCRGCGKGVKFKQELQEDKWNTGMWVKDDELDSQK